MAKVKKTIAKLIALAEEIGLIDKPEPLAEEKFVVNTEELLAEAAHAKQEQEWRAELDATQG